jgi:hypothetical protein
VLVTELERTVSSDQRDSLGLLIAFPSNNAALCKVLKIPETIQQLDCLLGAVYPWTLSSEHFEKIDWTPVEPPHRGPPVHHTPTKLAQQHALTDSVLYRSIALICFPKFLAEELRAESVAYCVWDLKSHHGSGDVDVETRALHTVLQRHKARDVGHKLKSSFVFIHIGALSSVYRFDMLNDRRGKVLNIRFLLYGTDLAAPVRRWGLREIWPLGEWEVRTILAADGYF